MSYVSKKEEIRRLSAKEYGMSEPLRLSTADAERVYDILVKGCGASENGRADFVSTVTTDGLTEYRFMGDLGFGGKLYAENPLRVSCYQEDETPDRLEMIALTNQKLAKLPNEQNPWREFEEFMASDRHLTQKESEEVLAIVGKLQEGCRAGVRAVELAALAVLAKDYRRLLKDHEQLEQHLIDLYNAAGIPHDNGKALTGRRPEDILRTQRESLRRFSEENARLKKELGQNG
jgi:hypothetical protein